MLFLNNGSTNSLLLVAVLNSETSFGRKGNLNLYNSFYKEVSLYVFNEERGASLFFSKAFCNNRTIWNPKKDCKYRNNHFKYIIAELRNILVFQWTSSDIEKIYIFNCYLINYVTK